MTTQNKSKPQRGRPYVAHPAYGIPTSLEGMLPWSHVVERMMKARNYWIGTIHPEGRPHTMPVWGVWVNDTLYFGGGPNTRWSRNLVENRQATVHLESGAYVHIFGGYVDRSGHQGESLDKSIDWEL